MTNLDFVGEISMASSKEYLEYILAQLPGKEGIATARCLSDRQSQFIIEMYYEYGGIVLWVYRK